MYSELVAGHPVQIDARCFDKIDVGQKQLVLLQILPLRLLLWLPMISLWRAFFLLCGINLVCIRSAIPCLHETMGMSKCCGNSIGTSKGKSHTLFFGLAEILSTLLSLCGTKAFHLPT